MITKQQKHLNYKERINLGSYYTNTEHVSCVWNFINPHIDNNFTILDSSCGYGNFLINSNNKKIGNDIDNIAIVEAQKNIKNISFFNFNALEEINRKKYFIKEKDKLCVIGNPPYNDRTSIIRQGVKKTSFNIDEDIETRDLGISFLLSYNKLNADVVCVLHPLSYLIKKSNFALLKNFSKNYKLEKAKIISSGTFKESSKSMQFPIIIGLYLKNKNGMTYDYIKSFDFEIKNKLSLKIKSFDYISNYVKKYPNKYAKLEKDSILFWTMRDINALKRNRTFINERSQNSIIIDKQKLDYYIYVDVFKRYSYNVPYYLGNCDVVIDNNLFLKFKKYFILDALFHNSQLRKYYANFDFSQSRYRSIAKEKINLYFKQLLRNHYAS